MIDCIGREWWADGWMSLVFWTQLNIFCLSKSDVSIGSQSIWNLSSTTPPITRLEGLKSWCSSFKIKFSTTFILFIFYHEVSECHPSLKLNPEILMIFGFVLLDFHTWTIVHFDIHNPPPLQISHLIKIMSTVSHLIKSSFFKKIQSILRILGVIYSSLVNTSIHDSGRGLWKG